MLRSKSDYKVFDVSNVDITGQIIPQIEVDGGTPKSIRLEDKVFLNEAYYQRYSYNSGKYSVSDKLYMYGISTLCTSIRSMESGIPDVGGLSINYIGSSVNVPSGVISGEVGQGADWMRLAVNGVFDFKTQGFTPDHKITTDALRRLYHDIDQFKYGSYDLSYTSSTENGNKYISGDWLKISHDELEENRKSGSVSVVPETTDIGGFGQALPIWGEVHHWSYFGQWFDNVSITKFIPTHYRIDLNIKNISDLWVPVNYYCSGVNDGSYWEYYGHQFLKCTKRLHSEKGYLTSWELPLDSFSERSMKQTLTTLGGIFPHATSETDTSSSAEISAYIRGNVLFKFNDNLFTAEVKSLGWKF